MLQLATQEDFDAFQRLKLQVHALHVSWRPDIYRMEEDLCPMDVYESYTQQRQLFVAKMGNTVAGYVRILIRERSGTGCVPSKILSVEEICVEEMLRGQGIGTQMMTDVRALGKAFGCSRLMIGGVYPQNDGAVAFYQKLGFQVRNINMDMSL